MDYNIVYNLFVKYKQIIRYLIVGGVVVSVNLSALYIFTDVFNIYYIISTIYAFLLSFCVSFFLQKFWTFNNQDVSGMRVARQMIFYLCLQGFCLSLNTALMYVFVEYLHIWYIASQAIISLVIAIGAFLISRRFIFTSINKGSPQL